MKFLPFILKHLRRNWIRTASTVLAMAVCIFLFCTLQTVLAAVNWAARERERQSRLVTRHAVSLVFNLPLAYGRRIQAVPGVKRVATPRWFGGSLPAKKEGKSEGRRVLDDRLEQLLPELGGRGRALLRDVPGVPDPARPVAGLPAGPAGLPHRPRSSPTKYGWKVGDTFFLESFIPPYRKPDGPFEFVVRAIFDADRGKHPGTDTNAHVLPLQVPLRGARAGACGAGTYNVEIEDPDQAGADQQGHRRPFREQRRPDPAPRPRRPSAPASSPWRGTSRCS